MAKTYEEGIIYRVVPYNPWWKDGERNPDRNDDTRRIMDLKNPEAYNHQAAINYFGAKFTAGTRKIMGYLDIDQVQIAVVPSSKVGKRSVGLEGVIGHANQGEVVYNPLFLVRIKDIDSAHEGGIRSKQQHIETIEVQVVPNPDIPLVLLDDVATTGTSFDACEQILRDAGVKEIYTVALGKTV